MRFFFFPFLNLASVNNDNEQDHSNNDKDQLVMIWVNFPQSDSFLNIIKSSCHSLNEI